jgi:hypothetical protein
VAKVTMYSQLKPTSMAVVVGATKFRLMLKLKLSAASAASSVRMDCFAAIFSE